jgi:hypothetical protein
MAQSARSFESTSPPPNSDPLNAIEHLGDLSFNQLTAALDQGFDDTDVTRVQGPGKLLEFTDEPEPTHVGIEHRITRRMLDGHVSEKDLVLSAEELTRHFQDLKITRPTDPLKLKRGLAAGYRIPTIWQAFHKPAHPESEARIVWVHLLAAACINPRMKVGHELRVVVESMTIEKNHPERESLFLDLISYVLYETAVGQRRRPIVPSSYPVEIHLFEADLSSLLDAFLDKTLLSYQRINRYTYLIRQ